MAAPSRSGPLDAVRGMAVLGVVAVHTMTTYLAAAGDPPLQPMVFRLFADGAFGVPLFFALSGWLLFYLYRNDPDFESAAYWKRRLARIWPLWAVFIVIYLIVRGVPDGGPSTGVALVICLLFLNWMSPALLAVPQGGMSIVQEMFHYVAFWVMRRRPQDLLLASVLVGYATYFIASAGYHLWPSNAAGFASRAWLDLGAYRTWPYFVAGGLSYLLWARIQLGLPLPQLRVRTWLLLMAALFVSFLVPYPPGVSNAHVAGVILVAAAIAIAASALPGIGPVLRSIGLYSYFIYFFHFWILHWLDAALPGRSWLTHLSSNVVVSTLSLVCLTAAVLAASWLVGWCSWRVFERPIIRWAHGARPRMR